MLSGGVERDQWYEISQSDFYIAILAMKKIIIMFKGTVMQII